MKFPIVWKNKIHVPNNQAVNIWVRLPQDTLWQISITMENRHFQWENPLFLWSFSIAMLQITRGYQKCWALPSKMVGFNH
jgi:hypothetical protein